MRKIVLYTLLAVSLLAFTACMGKKKTSGTSQSSSKTSQETTVWKFGHLTNDSHLWHRTAIRFADLVSEKTGGSLEIQVFPSEQLGSEVDVINDIKTGTADLTITGESLSNWAPETALLGIPYAITSMAHMDRVIGGALGEEIEKAIEDKVGLKPLYFHKRSPRNLTSNKPVRTPQDVQGLKMRVPNVPSFMAAWQSTGASPQVMAFSEVFTALQQNVIGAQENPYDLIVSASFYEVQKYVNETEHVFGWIYVVVGKEQFEALSASQKTAVIEAASEVEQWADQQLLETTRQAKEKVIAEGMQVVSDVDKIAFQTIMLPAVKETLNPEVLTLLDKVVAAGQ